MVLPDHESMLAFTVLMLLLFLGPLAYFFGADSRVDDFRR
jgi:hypothetical protein